MTRNTAKAATYLGSLDISIASLGISVGDVIQVSMKVQRTGTDTGGMVSEAGVRFVPTNLTPANASLWKFTADVANPTVIVGPEVTVPAGATGGPAAPQLRLRRDRDRHLGQFTILNLTTGGILQPNLPPTRCAHVHTTPDIRRRFW